MGQINCHCEQIPLDDYEHRFSLSKNHKLDTQQSSHSARNVVTKVTFTNSRASFSIRLKQQEPLTVGNSKECIGKCTEPNQNSFKMAVRMVGRSIMVRDGGVGYGVFVMRRKIGLKSNGEENFVSVDDKYLLIRIGERRIVWSIFDLQGEKTSESDVASEQEIKVGDTKLVLRRQKAGKDYSLRRADRRQLCLLLSHEQRVRLHQTLRLGCQYFAISGISTQSEGGMQ